MEIGKWQTVKVKQLNSLGVVLHGNADQDEIILPKKELAEDFELAEDIQVFIYRDAKDKLVATLTRPKLELHEVGMLTVVEVAEFGAFLDWGLEKDLLLPIKDQTRPVIVGEEVLVALYFNEVTKKVCATMYLYEYLSTAPPYEKGQRIEGTIYNINQEMGAFIAVENKYQGLLLNKELYGAYRIGDQVMVRVKAIREDGKLELSLRGEAHSEIEGDAKVIMDRIEAKGGVLPLNDKSAPEQIKEQLKMSKGAFKRAVGRLLKEGVIEITEKGLQRRW